MPIDPNIEPIEILRMALAREKEAHAFYKEAAGIVKHPAAKSTLLEMAEEEARHIRQLEEALDRNFYADN
jgi:rubrerythrin